MTTEPPARQDLAEVGDLYNRAFESLVKKPDDLVGLIAYGRYKWAKREWIRQKTARSGRRPTPEALAEYAETWTDSQLASVREAAEGALSGFALTILERETPRIEADALKQANSFWMDAWAGVVGAFAYTLLLILVAVILHVMGIDVLHAFSGAEGLSSKQSRPAEAAQQTSRPA